MTTAAFSKRVGARALAAASILAASLLPASCGRQPEQNAAPAPTRAAPAPPASSVETEDSAARVKRPPGGRAPVIWLGLDGLDWDLLDRLAREGKMPNWSRLVARGASARLKSFMPILSPIVWTSIATGVPPDVHRVLDFQEVEPATGAKMPISGRSRAVPAIWNVAAASGRTVGVVGWWATHPAEEVTGFFVSDHASPILFEGLPRAGVAFPAALAAGVEQIAAKEEQVSDAEIAQYVDVPLPEIARARASGKGLADPLIALSRIIGATRTVQRVARELYDRNTPELTMVYFEGTDAIGHVFSPFVPPRMSCVPEAEFAKYSRAVDTYYALVDRVLGQWMRRADEDGATLLINSDHGFKWGEDRPCERSSLDPATAAYWHRMTGVLAAYGARVKASEKRGDASVFDLAPTVSALLDLPVDSHLTGNLLRETFSISGAPAKKDLFSGTSVRRVEAAQLSEKQASEYAQRLRSLGYLSGGEPAKLAPTGGDRPGLTEGGWNNLGLYFRENTHDLAAAEAAFQKALALRPSYASPQFNLAVLYRERGNDAVAVDWLFRSLTAGHADPEGTILFWYTDYRDKKKDGPAREVLERGTRAYPDSEPIGRELAILRFKSKRDCPGALEAVSHFEATTQAPETLNVLGLVKTCLGRRDEAIALFQKSLSLNPDQAGVVQSLNILQKGAAPAP
ncbi:MAG TPA: alkaline phosphatase family protein [Thermoanaerobaculia bacterium]|jgi:predicted AlkP superfamily phosphohydrolase/phosphomutase|nr:alkaline phosphatase family protein [Thermoanaerobaculia bacterium]